MNAIHSDSTNVKVSVAMITYNHEPFIAQAIESVLIQKANFEYEIVIGEDCSTDNTRRIVIKYADKFPSKIRPLLQKNNRGSQENFVMTLQASKGKYIALLEGDDYWTDPYKLQKQVDFLESHPECVICFHNTLVTYEDNVKPSHLREKVIWDTYCLKEIIQANSGYSPPGHTCSAMFRNHLINDYPDWFYDSKSGDIPLFILLSSYGLAKYINETMGVHRIHLGGISRQHTGVHLFQNRIDMFSAINEHFGNTYNSEIKQIITKFYVQIAITYKQQHSLTGFAKTIIKSISSDPKTIIYLCENNKLSRRVISVSVEVVKVLKNNGIKALIDLSYTRAKRIINLHNRTT